MWKILLLRSTLFLALVASIAGAEERAPNERAIFFSDHPSQESPEVYVVGGVVTVLALEQPCDPTRTKMLGWEGRFEPLQCAGRWVLLAPIRDLEPKDRFMLLVTLADGTELPFTVTSRQENVMDRTGDQQVNVFRNREASKAVLASLYDSLRREEKLRETVARYQKEDSVDHALAALLLKGATKQTTFRERRRALFKSPTGVEFRITVSSSKSQDKMAVLFNVKNNSPTEPWNLMEARLLTADGREDRPFALRASRNHWGPGGESGQIAVVVDASAFDSKGGPERLVLELFRLGDGLRQAWVFLDQHILRE
jgi:uncharacterized protein (TIGR02268 family)